MKKPGSLATQEQERQKIIDDAISAFKERWANTYDKACKSAKAYIETLDSSLQTPAANLFSRGLTEVTNFSAESSQTVMDIGIAVSGLITDIWDKLRREREFIVAQAAVIIKWITALITPTFPVPNPGYNGSTRSLADVISAARTQTSSIGDGGNARTGHLKGIWIDI